MNKLTALWIGKKQTEFHLMRIMCRRIIFRYFFLLFLLIPIVSISAQTMEDADRLLDEGTEQLSQGDYTEALEKLGNSAQIYLKLGADKKSMTSLYYSGRCFLMLGNNDMALTAYQMAFSLAEKIDSKYEKAMIQNQIGFTYFHMHNPEMALSYFNEALRYYTMIGDLQEIAKTNRYIAAVFTDANRFDEALVKYLKLIKLYDQLSDYEQAASHLENAGLIYGNSRRFQEAADCFERAAGIYADLGLRSLEVDMLYYSGVMQKELGNFDVAREILQIALVMQKELRKLDGISDTMQQLGEIEQLLGNYHVALEHYEQAYEINKSNAHPRKLAFSLNHLGVIYMIWGRYDDALKFYEESLAISRTIDDSDSIAANLSDIGQLYTLWGRYDQSLEFCEEALAAYRQLKNKGGIGTLLSNIGALFSLTGQLEMSLLYMKEALTLYEELGDHREVALLYNNLGQIYYFMGDYDLAARFYEQSLELSERIGLRDVTATVFNNLGSLYRDGKADNKAAIEYYIKALMLLEELEKQDQISIVLNNIGAGYGNMENYDKAIDFLNRAVELKETLRITAEGSIRRDYLDSQLHTYQHLYLFHIRNGNPAKAFETMELSLTKYLLDQLSEGLDESILNTDPVKTYLSNMSRNSTIISFTNIIGGGLIARFNADRNRIDALELPLKSFLDTINNKHGSRISEDLFYLDIKDQLDESGTATFEEIINYYRYLLTAYSLGSDEREILYDIETSLYKFLFSGLKETLHGKDEILIIPGGVLAFIPFEALRMPDDRYLVERFNIRYAQSLSVLNTLESRQYDSSSKEPLLAFGGAVYDEQSYEKSIVESEKQLEAVMQSTLRDLDRGLNVEETYQMLGMGSWDNLPGTIAEVQAIGSIVPESTIYTGERVNEAFVKSLSTQGVLKDYRVLHFATHGLVVPEIPELSAVVLSLTDDMGSEEDGYLRMGEIAGLEIEADFINLSACETGLGKIYGGEGVVGLTQSFLVAGANGLSVSLWQVSDESTMEFMTGVYRLVSELGIDYDLAMTEMKRCFIAGGQYSEPFYWAPFVYYGK